MKKIITFVNDTPHADVEELSLTYQSSIFFSDNGVNDQEYLDIYHGTYLYSYVQSVNENHNAVLFSSGFFKINYEDDKLSSSYIYLNDEEVTLYPTNNEYYSSSYNQNDYIFEVYHSNDIYVNINNFEYDMNIFTLANIGGDKYKLSIKNPRMNSAESLLKYKYNNNEIYTNIHIIRNTPKFSFAVKNIIVNNSSYFNIPFSLIDNQNHNKIKYTYNSNYLTKYNDLRFKAIAETNKNAYTTIYASIGNIVSYAYVTIAPKVKAESMSIQKYQSSTLPYVNNHVIPTINQDIINRDEYINYIPYHTSYNNASAGSNNTFKLKIFPKDATHKNVEWHSTDPLTMNIVNIDNTNNVVKVKYYRPGKVILYATHSKNNDNELRAFIVINITGGVIITKIFDINTEIPSNPNFVLNSYHVIDGNHMIFKVGHQPKDSELSLIFEGEGENYIDNDRAKYDVIKNEFTAYSYFNTYANIQNWEDETSKTYTFSIAYTNSNTNNEEYALSKPITFYKLYSDTQNTSGPIIERTVNGNTFISDDNTIYKGDSAKLSYYFKCYPNLGSNTAAVAVDTSIIQNNASYESVIQSNGVNYTFDNNTIKSHSNQEISIDSHISENDIRYRFTPGEYIVNNSFISQYNSVKTIGASGNQKFYVKPPFIDTNILDVTYGYTGIIGSYVLKPNNARFNIVGNQGLYIEFNNSNLIFQRRKDAAQEYNISYTITNGNYTTNNSFNINVVPVEIQIQDINGNPISSYQCSLDENISTTTIDLTYILLPDENVVDFNKECTVEVDNNSSANITASLINDEGTYKLHIEKNNSVMQFDNNNLHRCDITITNTVSMCKTLLQVVFNLNKVYITVLSISHNANEYIYYNSNGNTNYKNEKYITVRGEVFNPSSSSLTTPVNASTNDINLRITPSVVNIGPSNSTNTVKIYQRDNSIRIYNANLEFSYLTGPGNQTGNMNMNVTSYALPEGIINFVSNSAKELYENKTVTFNMNVTKYNEMSPQMKNMSYWYIQMDTSKFTKQSAFSYTLKNLNRKSNYPIEEYNLQYGLNSQFTPSGNSIDYNTKLYLMYTYFTYTIDNLYYGLNTDSHFKLFGYINENNIGSVSLVPVQGFDQYPLNIQNTSQYPLSYNGNTLTNKYTVQDHKVLYNALSNTNYYKINVTYNNTTYCSVQGIIYHPTIQNNVENNFITYTNGDDSTNWKQSFVISYQKQNDWPNNYNGNWSYWYDGSQISGQNGKYAPTNNSSGGKQFYIKCDKVKSDEKKIYTHTLCDKFELDTNKSYLPIVVASGYPYIIVNKYQGVQANNSNANIDIAPESYVASSNTSYFTSSNKTITYNKVSDDYQREVTITYSCGRFTDLTAQYPVYTINYGFTNLTLMRKTSEQLNGYINGITGASLEFSTNTPGTSIYNNTLSFSGVSSSSIGQNVLINITCTYAAENNKNYVFNSTQNVKVLPYRYPNYIIQLQFSVSVTNITTPDRTSTLYSGGEIFTTEGANNTSDTHYDDYPIFKMTLENNSEIYLVVNGHKATKSDYLRTCNFQFALKKMSGGLFVNIDNNENIFTSSVSQLNITQTTPPETGYDSSPITLSFKTDLEYNNLIFDNIVIDDIETQRVGIYL